jgi:hypothetical protein
MCDQGVPHALSFGFDSEQFDRRRGEAGTTHGPVMADEDLVMRMEVHASLHHLEEAGSTSSDGEIASRSDDQPRSNRFGDRIEAAADFA